MSSKVGFEQTFFLVLVGLVIGMSCLSLITDSCADVERPRTLGMGPVVSRESPVSPDGLQMEDSSTAGIQEALEYLYKANGGGVVKLAPKAYIISSTIEIPSNCTLEGSGIGATVIKLRHSLSKTVSEPVTLVSSVGENVKVRNLTIDGNRMAQSWPIIGNWNYGLDMSARNFIVENVETKNVTANGMGCSGKGGKVFFENGIFRNCISHDNGKKGFHSGPGRNITIIGNTFYNNELDSGIGIHQGLRKVIISNNICYNNGTYGIHIGDSGVRKGGSERVVQGNICYDNGIAGIFLASREITNPDLLVNTIVNDNLCFGNGHGIIVTAARGFSICNNIVFGSEHQGIRVDNSSDGVILGNVVYGNGGSAIDIRGVSVSNTEDEDSQRLIVALNYCSVEPPSNEGVNVSSAGLQLNSKVYSSIVSLNHLESGSLKLAGGFNPYGNDLSVFGNIGTSVGYTRALQFNRFIPIGSAEAPRGSLFVDLEDGLLKFKDAEGMLHKISETPGD